MDTTATKAKGHIFGVAAWSRSSSLQNKLEVAVTSFSLFCSNFGIFTTDGIPEILSRNALTHTEQLQDFGKKYLSMRNFNTKSERH